MSQDLNLDKAFFASEQARRLHAGDDYDLTFTLKQSGIALDLTGASVWFTVKDRAKDKDSNAKIQLTTGSGISISGDPVNGIVVVSLSSSDTASLEGLWKYDLQVKLATPSTKTMTMLTGVIEFLPNVTLSNSIP